MKDPEFAKAYSDIQPEMNVIRAIIDITMMNVVLVVLV